MAITLLQSVVHDDVFIDGVDAGRFADADALTTTEHELSYVFKLSDGSIRLDFDPKNASSDELKKVEVHVPNAEVLAFVSEAEFGSSTALDPNVYEVTYVFAFNPDADGERQIRVDIEQKP